MNTNFWNRLLLTPVVGLALIAAPVHAAQKVSAQASDLKSAEPAELASSEATSPVELAASPAAAVEAAAPSVQPVADAAVPVAPIAPVTLTADAAPVAAPAAAPAAPLAPVAPVAQPAAAPTGEILTQVNQYSGNSMGQVTSASSMGQVTSITQLSDVQPTDWAYQALQSLVERYGCIAGYPDGTYKGQRAMTRFEFAAGMNACLDRISELIASSTADLATKEDLATLQRLQEEFAAELAALRGRVDSLEARTAELEANQFSTTTKLAGETVFGVAGAWGSGSDDTESLEDINQILAAGRVRLNFDTSFSGNDLLRARLQAGNMSQFNSTDSDGNVLIGSDGRLGFQTDTDNDIQLDILTYQFKLGPFAAIAAAQAPDFYDLGFFNVVSPFASAGRGAISRFGRFNPIFRTASGTGGGLGFEFDFASVKVAYLAGGSADSAGNPSLSQGLFNGDYGMLAQVTATPFKGLTAAFTYVNSYTGDNDNNGGSAIGFNTGTGSTRSRVRVGSQPTIANSYGAELNFAVAPWLQIGGFFTYSAVRVIGTGDAQVWTYAGTVGFPDLGGKGSLLGFVVGVEPYLGGTTGFTVSDQRQDTENGVHIEGFYRFQLNDNISITPGVIWLTAPNHSEDNSDAVIGAIRTTFTF